MTVFLALVAAGIGFLSGRHHVKAALGSETFATRMLHVGLAVVWHTVAVAYVWVAFVGGGAANQVGALLIRPSLVMIGALHLGLEGQYRRGEW